jgi:hypothetical protein
VGGGASTSFNVDLKNIGLTVAEAKQNIQNFHTVNVLGYESLNMREADNLKAVEDVLWAVNQALQKLETRLQIEDEGSRRTERAPLLG